MMNQNRNINLDLMRLLGVLIIMVAHAVIYSTREIAGWAFIQKRLSRLIFPTWVFLAVGFSVTYLITVMNHVEYPFSLSEIVESFLFYDGIGFVWVFKVYIILALLTPFAIKFSQSKMSNHTYFALLIALYILYELVLALVVNAISPEYLRFFNSVIFVIAPYSILYLYGMRASLLSNRQLIGVLLLSLTIFVSLMIFKYIQLGQFVTSQEFKYPPTLYYLSYAFFALNSVYLVIRAVEIKSTKLREVIFWLSSHSLWIYLWHIMGFFIWRMVLADMFDIGAATFILNACFLLLFGVAMTYLQTSLIKPLKASDAYWSRKLVTVLN